MRSIRRIIVIVLVSAVVFQALVLELLAVTAKMEPTVFENVIRFDLSSENQEGSDPAEVFPEEIYLQEAEIENPLKQLMVSNPTQYESVPDYFQQSYGESLYGEGTVESCGSSITALAMVATYLTGYSYLPDELARWFAAKANDDVARLTYASKALGLPFETSGDWKHTYEQLQEGKLAVIQTDATSLFSDSWHFIVLKGVTEDGKILVNDPFADNLLNEDLKEKYSAGFEEVDISTGFCYAWIYDKDKIPADIARYASAWPENETDRYAELKLTPTEKQLLARVVYVKANGECEEGQQMLVEVILNRLLSDDYPDVLKKIVCGEDALCEASALSGAKLTPLHYWVVERALKGPYLLEESVTDFSYECHK